eukprot:1161842-Pelagomonas_calceolata.AAC.1
MRAVDECTAAFQLDGLAAPLLAFHPSAANTDVALQEVMRAVDQRMAAIKLDGLIDWTDQKKGHDNTLEHLGINSRAVASSKRKLAYYV